MRIGIFIFFLFFYHFLHSQNRVNDTVKDTSFIDGDKLKKIDTTKDSLINDKLIKDTSFIDSYKLKKVDTTKDSLINDKLIKDTSFIDGDKLKKVDTTKDSLINDKLIKDTSFINDYKLKKVDTPSNEEPKYNDYFYRYVHSDFFSIDTVDTIFNINTYYRFNDLRKDHFAKIRINNIGQGYNNLTYDDPVSIYPKLGATMKFWNYMREEDLKYYNVDQPFTELFYLSGMEEGQAGGGLISFNLSDSSNFTFSYKGISSLGKYKNSKSTQGVLITSFRSQITNSYNILAHFAYQDLRNQENGGIKDKSQFESGETRYFQRSLVDVNMENAESFMRSKRFYTNQFVDLIKSKDTSANSKPILKASHKFSLENQYYIFEESNVSNYFGELVPNSNTSTYKDSVNRNTLKNQFSVISNISDFIGLGISYTNFKLKYSVKDSNRIDSDLNYLSANMDINSYLGIINIKSKYKIPDAIFGQNYLFSISWDTKLYDYGMNFSAATYSIPPYLTYMYYSGYYTKMNWENSFDSEKISRLGLSFNYSDLKSYISNLELSVKYFNINNHLYIDKDYNVSQYADPINFGIAYFGLSSNIWKIYLNSRIIYQQIFSGNDVFRLPDLVVKTSLVYSDIAYSAYFDVGIDFNYFSEFFSNDYLPVINSFYLGDRKIGAYPMINAFLILKIKNMKIYGILEHLNSVISERNYYSLPGHPYTDLKGTLGILWNFFT